MIQLILMLGLTGLRIPGQKTAQIQPCNWPHKCAAPVVAQIQTCSWPHRCEVPVIVQFANI